MDKINCEIIEDVMPLYVDYLASKSTREMVDTHLKECENCRKKMQKMQQNVIVPMEMETEPIKKIQKKIQKKNQMIAFISGFIILILAILAVIHLNSPILIDNYEDAVNVKESKDGKISLVLSERVKGYSLTEMNGEEGAEGVYSLSCWDTKWNQLFASEQEREINISDKNITQIYYYSPKTLNEQQDALIYDDGTNIIKNNGIITLPRLVLYYYLFFAGILSVIGIFISIMLRKKDKKYISQKITLYPVCYFISSFVILCTRNDIYNAEYYFSGIMILSIVVYMLMYYVMNCCIWKK